ncbi:(deoxy)nucleoside triphosphate pyrophosphohydrolase [Sphingobacterium tabacisoli]|uniref:8-oxo-dGTP diphosphatase n=1 Tax=Sphingobacterium tabacisoli TaxID=2044855 RepID=A0ABW5L409_9SPHI|nr:(deoxy)nucleoside triphosphate pyrophosphohydrolase [Sphingobacterium tabacisoli]
MLHVTCAIIVHHNKILICQRSKSMKLPLKWEFPGGKIETGESKEACLQREVRKELALDIRVDNALSPVEHCYPTFALYLYPFICTIASGVPDPVEHAQAIWVSASDLLNYDWAEADIPIVKEYLTLRK